MSNYTYDIQPDQYFGSPRDYGYESDMITFHKYYQLGDEHSYKSISDAIASIFITDIDEDKEYTLQDIPAGVNWLPIYLYDHGGLTIKDKPFNDAWDSGLAGFIYSFTETTDQLRQEIEEYDSYLRGDIWQYSIYDCNGEEVESCSGFIGRDACETEVLEIINKLPEVGIKPKITIQFNSVADYEQFMSYSTKAKETFTELDNILLNCSITTQQ